MIIVSQLLILSFSTRYLEYIILNANNSRLDFSTLARYKIYLKGTKVDIFSLEILRFYIIYNSNRINTELCNPNQ